MIHLVSDSHVECKQLPLKYEAFLSLLLIIDK